jgi:dTMP kinase|tara:strand:+ start:208 stop:828 length:621 start_codon:yes stop_codon:yes gene_type:complete
MRYKKFITFEGGEGSGKSTQIKLLAKKIAETSSVCVTREPGGTTSAEEIRKLLVRGKADKWSSVSELLLLFAARKDHIDKLILPALSSNKWVLCDRFVDSTYVYQGMCGKTSLDVIKKIEKIVIGQFKPELTFLINIDPKVGIQRSKRPGNKDLRYENMDIKFHNKIYKSYLKLASLNKRRIFMIDGSKTISDIENEIWNKVKNKI